MAIRGHQRVISEPSEVISDHISGHQRRPSVAISGHQWPSVTIRGHQWPYKRPSEKAISGHQWPSADLLPLRRTREQSQLLVAHLLLLLHRLAL